MNQNESADEKIAKLLEKIVQIQRGLLWDASAKENLSPIQLQFLLFLVSHPENLRTVSSLADEFDLTRPTVSDAVSSLAEKGLVKKVKDAGDKRISLLEVTAEGKKTAERSDRWHETIVNHIAGISGSDKTAILSFLVELVKNLFDDGLVNSARMCLTCSNFIRSGKTFMCGVTGRKFQADGIVLDCGIYSQAE